MQTLVLPGKFLSAAKIEEFESLLGTLSWGDIAYYVSDDLLDERKRTYAQVSLARSVDRHQPMLGLLPEFSFLRSQSMAIRWCLYAVHSKTIRFHHGG
jgi:hypothetical protein